MKSKDVPSAATEVNAVVKDAARIISATYIGNILRFLRSLINLRLLGPVNYGLWSGLGIILSYSGFAHLGAVDAMYRLVPLYHGQRDYEKAENVQNTVFGACLVIYPVLGALVFIASFFTSYDALTNTGIRVIAVLLIIEQIQNFYSTLLSAHKQFSLLSKGIILFTVISVLATLILVYLYNIYGLFGVALLIPVLSIAYYQLCSGHRLRIRINLRETVALVRYGFPLLVLGLLSKVFMSVDKIMIIKLLGKESLGYYAIGTILSRFIMQIPFSVGRVTAPRIQEKMGETGNVSNLRYYLLRPLSFLASLTAIIMAMSVVVGELLIGRFLPSYAPGLNAMRILITGAFFLCVTVMCRNCIIALGKQLRIIPLFMTAIVSNIILNYIFLKTGRGIAGVASATVIAYFLYSVSIIAYSLKCLNVKSLQVLSILLKAYAPFLYMGSIILVLTLAFASPVPGISGSYGDTFRAAMKLVVVGIFSIPLVYRIWKVYESSDL